MFRTVLTALSLLFFILGWGQTQVSNLPTIFIETDNGKGIYSKETYVPCKVTVASDNEADVIVDRAAGIRGRGNSTWGMAKKPYRIKFDKKLNFFNRPAKAKSWTLLANYADKTLMRNAVAFEISRFVGFDFSPSAIFVDVVLNGEVLGNYLVSDQMEVNNGRVEIDEMDATCIEGESLTGGYFLEVDGFGDYEPVHFNTSRGLIITVKSPDEEVIQPVQLNYIKNYINNFESLLFSSKFDDPDTGFRKMVDQRSLVDWYICCELTGNSDSFWSTYLYKKRNDDHLYFGPLWDFDIAFNNDDRLGDAVYKLMRDNAHDPKTWIKRMWQAQWFKEAVCVRWCQLREQGIEEFLIDFIDSTADYIDQSQQINFNKWRVLNQKVYREQFLFSSYQGGVDYLKEYIHKRISFLDMSFRSAGATTVIDEIQQGEPYYLLHYVGLYGTAEQTNFYIENPSDQSQRQKLAFVSAGSGRWNIKMDDGRLLASKTGDKYCGYTLDGTDSHAQFTVEPSKYPGYAIIKNIYTGQYLGVEHTAHYSRVSTNKDGQSTYHAWKILPVNFTNGIAQTALDNDILRYEPARDVLISDKPCSVYNVSGQCIIASANNEIPTSALPMGLYIARTTTRVIKFIK